MGRCACLHTYLICGRCCYCKIVAVVSVVVVFHFTASFSYFVACLITFSIDNRLQQFARVVKLVLNSLTAD